MPDAQLLKSILRKERLTPLFQPIADAGGRGIFGYEALIRGPVGTPLDSPWRCSTRSPAADTGSSSTCCAVAWPVHAVTAERLAQPGLSGHLPKALKPPASTIAYGA
ncbi:MULTISPECIES: hypothetical protein [Halomonadaceae]|uniref:hypothetical protein n=1 Tax=Halomonadaceae TaxID=28256 RepID=UPI001237442E|nr:MULTISPECIES: hypothetical protein [Halomonas]MCD6007834.1 hypothetical protein [Halomonas sp. IOP_31]